MQQADSDRLDLEGAAGVCGREHACFVERLDHDAARADPLLHFQHARRRHRPGGLHPGEIVGAAGNVLPADGEHVAKARRGHQSRARPLALQDHVGGDGRAVQHALERRRAVARVGERHLHAGQERLAGVGRHRRRLGAPDPAALGVVQGDVGEGAADVDGDGERRVRRGCRHNYDDGTLLSRDAWRGAWSWPTGRSRRRRSRRHIGAWHCRR